MELIRKTKSTTNDVKTGVNIQRENCLVYAKNKESINLLGRLNDSPNYNNPDSDPGAKSGSIETGYFPVVNPYTGKEDYSPEGMYWRFSKNTSIMEPFVLRNHIGMMNVDSYINDS